MKSKQYAALPFRKHRDDLEIMLITTRSKHRWSIPKGWPIKRETPHGTAAIEAFEEAGLIGKIAPFEIGRFKHRKQGKRQESKCEVQIFPLRVRAQKQGWPEKGQRQLRWLPVQDAAQLVHKSGLRRAIQNLSRDHG